MANNFRIQGDAYVSKAGHDSNTGSIADSPKKTITVAQSPTLAWVVGAGIYNVSSGIVMQGGNPIPRYADGKVIIDFQGLSGFLGSGNNPHYGFFFKNSSALNVSLGNFNECIFDNVNINTVDGTNAMYMNNCILVNTTLIRLGSSEYTVLINSSTTINNGAVNIKNIYLNFTSSISYSTNPTNPNQFANNNIQGTLIFEGFSYAIQDQLTGTPQDNGYEVGVEWLTEANLTANGYTGTIAGWNAAVATCINRDPRFNDASKGIFTLKADSPHLGRASDGISNIGGTEYEDLELVGNLSSRVLLVEVSEAIDNTTNPNDWVLKAGYEEGYVRIIKRVTDSEYKTLANIPYYGNYSFDSDEIGGASGNFNVPDSKPQTNNYPTYTATTSDALDVNSIIISGHGRIAGEWIRVQGQDREISSVDTNTIYFLTAVRAIVLAGTEVKIGSESELAALLPNRLNFELRTSKEALVDASNWNIAATWDNDALAAAGTYLAQELNNTPMIDNLNGVGFGDDLYDSAFGNKIRAKYVDMKIWIRNNYKS